MAKKSNKEEKASCEMYLYGIIGRDMDIDTNRIIADVEQKRKGGIRDFTFYINSDGGEVAQGSALFNYLDRTDINVTFVIDGIAASMMAVLITNPKHTVKAAKYAKFMYHRVCGYTYGNSDETRSAADMMDNFEGTLIEMMSKRMGMSEEETRNRYFDGLDHWLSAKEALEAGLCDEIINEDIEIKELKNITNARDAFNYYNNQIINLKQSKKMEKAKEFASVLNIAETATESAMLDSVTGVVNERNDLSVRVKALETKNADLENRLSAVAKAKVTTLIDTAIAAKKLGEDDREAYTKLAEQDYDNTEKILNKMQSVPKVVDGIDKGTTPKEESDWDFDRYHKSGKLENLKTNNPDRFKEVFKAKFGFDPKM